MDLLPLKQQLKFDSPKNIQIRILISFCWWMKMIWDAMNKLLKIRDINNIADSWRIRISPSWIKLLWFIPLNLIKLRPWKVKSCTWFWIIPRSLMEPIKVTFLLVDDLIDYEALDLFIFKENKYLNSHFLFTMSGSLILIFSMLFVMLLYMSFKYHKLNSHLKKEARTFKSSFMQKSLFSSMMRNTAISQTHHYRQIDVINTDPYEAIDNANY